MIPTPGHVYVHVHVYIFFFISSFLLLLEDISRHIERSRDGPFGRDHVLFFDILLGLFQCTIPGVGIQVRVRIV